MKFIIKKTQLFLLLFCLTLGMGVIHAQGVYRPSGGAVTLTTQASVDALGTALGTDTIFEGDITISESRTSANPITNLSIFSGITEIRGFLFINSTKSLTTLSHEIGTSGEYAFGALESITGNFFVGDPSNTTSLTNTGNFPKLKSIGGGLNISGNPVLSSIDAENFPVLATIGGALNFSRNNVLSTIAGFPVLKNIGGFSMSNNDALTSIGNFSALTTIDGDFKIGGNFTSNTNDVLTTLGDYPALIAIGGDITIRNNPMLSDCSSLPARAIDYAADAGRTITISDNALGCGSVPLTTQADVTALGMILGDTTIFNGNITINEDSDDATLAITDLSVFSNLTQIRGNFNITSTKSLTTLSHETSDGSGVYAFGALESITGNFNVGSSSSTTSLTSIGNFPNLMNVGGGFSISNNDSLTDMGNYPALTTIGGNFLIGGDPGEGNDILPALSDFSVLDTIGGNVTILDNPKLSNCGGLPTAVVNQVENAGQDIFIDENATGCNISATLTLATQTQVDAVSLVDATLFIGNITISEASTSTDTINDLSVFKNITEIRGNLTITATTNLTTLSHETSAGSGEYAFGALESITGNFNVGSSGDTTSLTTLGTFPNLISIGGALVIRDNEELQSFGDLSALASIGAYLRISHNEKLTDLGGLSALTSIGKSNGVFVPSEDDNIDSVSIIVESNTTLAACCNLTNLLPGQANAVTGSVFINSNAEDCNTADTGTDIEKVTAFVEACEATVVLSATGITVPTDTETNYTASAAAAGDTLTIDITLENATGWEVMITGAFVTSAPTTGNNEDNAVLTITENTTTDERMATITFTSTGGDATVSQTLIITQEAAEPTLAITGINARSITSEAGTEDIIIASNTDFRVSTSDDLVTSLTFTTESASAGTPIVPSSGSITLEGMGNGTLQIAYSANTTTDARTGTFTLSALDASNVLTTPTPITITLTQEAPATSPRLRIAASGITAPAGSETNYTYNASVAGETLTIDVTLTGGATDWTVIADAFVTSAPTTGNNDVDAVLTIAENTTTDERMATITFTSTGGDATVSQTLIITQEAAEPTLAITGKNIRSITSEAGTEDIIIASNTDFRVSTSDDLVTSLTFTPESASAGTPIVPSSGSITLEGMGNGTLQIAYSENTTTDARTGTLTLSALDASNVLTNFPCALVIPCLSALDGSNVLTTPTPITITLTQEAPATSPRLRIAASGITAPAGSETNYTYNASVAGETLTIDVTLTGGATDWTVIADAFVTSALTTGNNDDNAVLTITENTTTDERMATLIFTSSGGEGKIDTQTLVITQAAAAKIMLTSHAEGDSIAIAHDSTDPITIDFTLGGSATGWKDTIIYMPDTTNFVTMDTLKDDTISITITPSANTGAAARTATITLITTGHEGTPDSVSLTIRQGARADTTVTLPPKDTTTLYSYTGVDFSLYPNPTKGNLTIEGITGYLQIYIHDLVGREVMTYSLTPSNKILDVSNLPSGMYVVTVQAENKTWTEVLVIVN